MSDQTDSFSANPGYVLGQLAKAFATSQSHEDPVVRAQAEKKIENWIKVFQGMLSGEWHIGSRTPVAGIPGWVTLQVITGGFATGEFLAAGPLQPHEVELLAKFATIGAGTVRNALNSYYLSDQGISDLQELLASGKYRIKVPEEGALLTVAWLLRHGHPDQARALLDEIGPYLAKLRFYPVPADHPLGSTSAIHLQTVGETVQRLKALRDPTSIEKQKESALVWAPLYDRTVALFLETVSGPPPRLQKGNDGRILKTANGKLLIEGGWPCQQYPSDWPERAQALLAEYRTLRLHHHWCVKPERKAENFHQLRTFLKICSEDPTRLTGREVGTIRRILAAIRAKRGLPESTECQQLRQAQVTAIARPTKEELAREALNQLAKLPPDEGLDTADDLLSLIFLKAAGQSGLSAKPALVERLGAKLLCSLNAPVEALVEKGVITSGEVLARVIPQISAQIRAASLADADLRRLYGAIYVAFRRRRSLLLLKLEHQIKIEELPWVQAIDAHRQGNSDTRDQARQTLQQVVRLTLTAFPYQILPNKLLQEIRSLAGSAGLPIPIVDEIAADIFMGDFSPKYLQAAQAAGELLQGTLYERYYGISYSRVRRIGDVQPARHSAAVSPLFAELCREMAGVSQGGSNWSVAANGKIIEQEQILTTHNLAVLFVALNLEETLRPRLVELAQRCFAWICQRQQQRIGRWTPRLRMLKNTAYAWRQMIFWLALLPDEAQNRFLTWAFAYLERQHPEFHFRFKPALDGLALIIQQPLADDHPTPETAQGARRFLGWTTGKHWLME